MNPDRVTLTELTPYYAEDGFVGKVVQNTGKVVNAPKITWWRWREVTIEPTIEALFDYLVEARKKNVCLIRGTNANPRRRRTRRQIAYRGDRGDHGFVDRPERVLWMDGDGIELPAGDDWITDPQGVVAGLVARMGEPWCRASVVWLFSSTHGLEMDKYKVWTGGLTHGDLRVRLGFLTTRAITYDEARAMTMMAKARFPAFDVSLSDQVHINYVARPLWEGHPGEDVLGEIQNIGWVPGEEEFLAIPDDLTTQARWLKAQGHGGGVAKHASAEAAVRNIGKPIGADDDDDESKTTATGTIRPHLGAAANHLLRANPLPDGVTRESHAATITEEIKRLIEEHRSEIDANLRQHRRMWSEVTGYMERNIPELVAWMIAGAYRPGKTVELIKAAPGSQSAQSDPNTFEADLASMRKRVAATVKRFETSRVDEEPVPVTLLSSPTGGGKSTRIRDAANTLLQARPSDHDRQTVIIALPTHRLGTEQVEMFEREHPNSNLKQAIVRGRYAADPEHPGKLMCWRPDEAKQLEMHLISIDNHLCRKGRGKNKVECRHFHRCGYQRQKTAAADLDLGYVAHEALQHRKPKVVGHPRMLFIDESPLDAFLFGTDQLYEVSLDALTDEPRGLSPYERAKLTSAREELHDILSALPTSNNYHIGTPVASRDLATFSSSEAAELRRIEWMGRIKVDIRPDTSRAHNEKELERLAGHNRTVGALATLWRLIENVNRLDDSARPELCGHIQVARGEKGRVIRMCGIRNVADSWEPSKPDDDDDDDDTDTASNIGAGHPNPRFYYLGPVLRGVCAHCGRREESVGGLFVLEDTHNPERPVATLHSPCARPYFDALLPKYPSRPSRRVHRKIPILLTDATGDVEILKHIWPHITSEEHPMLHNPNVKTFQVTDKALSKTMIAPESKTEAQRRRQQKATEAARRMYAALLRRGLEYGGEPVAAIVYKSTEDWITKNCFIPNWLTLTHHGAVAGLDKFKDVRALFVVGRSLPKVVAVVRQAEALTGRHIPVSDYLEAKGRIPIVAGLPGPFEGCDAIEVAQWRHPDPLVDRLRRQACEVGIIQAAGRARALLRTPETPLDLHLWTDVPVPELGPVIPELWADQKVGLDWIMLAMGGVWVESAGQAEKAYPGLIGEEALKQDRRRHPQTIPDLETLIRNVREKAGRRYVYQLAGKGHEPARVFFLNGTLPEADGTPTDPAEPFSGTKRISISYTLCTSESPGDTSSSTAYVQAWLEQRLGPLRSLEAGWPPHTSPLFAIDPAISGAEVGTPDCWSGTQEELDRRNAEASAKLVWTTPVLTELFLTQAEIDALNAEVDAQEAEAKGRVA